MNAQPARTEQPSAAGLGGLQPYPSRTKDPDTVDFSTGAVGIGATAPIWSALSHRYVCDRFPETPRAGRFCSLLGDAEMDEGAVWEAIIDPGGAHARRDRVVRRSQPAAARSGHPRCADQAAPGHVRSRRLAGAHLPLAAPARSGLRRPRRAGARGPAREDDQPRVPAAAARPPERGPRPSARRPVRGRGGRAAGRDRAAPAAGRPRDPHRRRGARRARLHPKAVISSQVALGRFLSDLKHVSPEVAHRVVTVSPDVATSTNLGGWINKTGIWSPAGREDWFSDDRERVLRWQEGGGGQHIELGIAEISLVCLASELESTGSRWGQPLLPIATICDPFINRALEPWTFSPYAGGRSIMVGTPSGVTLAPEGGAHQS